MQQFKILLINTSNHRVVADICLKRLIQNKKRKTSKTENYVNYDGIKTDKFYLGVLIATKSCFLYLHHNIIERTLV